MNEISAILDSLSMHDKAKLTNQILKDLSNYKWIEDCVNVSLQRLGEGMNSMKYASRRVSIRSSVFDILRSVYEQ